MGEILFLLAEQDMTASELCKALNWKHTKVYLALVSLEAQGLVEVLLSYTQDRRPIARWSKCEVTV